MRVSIIFLLYTVFSKSAFTTKHEILWNHALSIIHLETNKRIIAHEKRVYKKAKRLNHTLGILKQKPPNNESIDRKLLSFEQSMIDKNNAFATFDTFLPKQKSHIITINEEEYCADGKLFEHTDLSKSTVPFPYLLETDDTAVLETRNKRMDQQPNKPTLTEINFPDVTDFNLKKLLKSVDGTSKKLNELALLL